MSSLLHKAEICNENKSRVALLLNYDTVFLAVRRGRLVEEVRLFEERRLFQI